MPSGNALNYDCNWRFAANVRSSEKDTVGYVLFWSGCGGLSLKKDITVWNPYDAAGQKLVTGEQIECIGLIDKFEYEGGELDPIRISAYVSKSTAADVRAKLARPLTNTKLKLSWYIIDFDEDKKLWYEAAFVKTPAKAEANIDSAGGELQVFIATEPTKISETLDLNVYRFEFQVVPADKKKATLEFATGPQTRLVKRWGE
ncbi:MAG: hypothetical protein OXU20_33450 [Myxococcales bacterium]|nr:hypothetical protein [Myxococcales bacterium]MDD9966919.1 hypothetical protein [Myxococcales bacterium]